MDTEAFTSWVESVDGGWGDLNSYNNHRDHLQLGPVWKNYIFSLVLRREWGNGL